MKEHSFLTAFETTVDSNDFVPWVIIASKFSLALVMSAAMIGGA